MVLLVDFVQDVVSVLIKILEPRYLILELPDLLILHARTGLVVIVLISLMVLFEVLYVRL